MGFGFTELIAMVSIAGAAISGGTSETKLVDSNGAAGDSFGQGGSYQALVTGPGVAIDGDLMVVSAPGDDVLANTDQGSATVFRRSGSAWLEEQELLASSFPKAFDAFGSAAAVQGDVVAVGAQFGGTSIFSNEGIVTVFRWNGATWLEEQVLSSSNPVHFSGGFGRSLSMNGDVIAVGTPLGAIGGKVEVFRWNGATWVADGELTPSTGDGRFGQSVTVSGDVLVGGAPRDAVGANNNQGTATVFRWNGLSWAEEQTLTDTSGGAGDYFGSSVAVDGDVLVVGATEVFDAQGTGYATVFRWSGSSWIEEQRLSPAGGSLLGEFGSSVAVNGNKIVVGAWREQSATVFEWTGSVWTESDTLTASDDAPNNGFGASVDLDGDTVVVGAPGSTIGANAGQGAAYVYEPDPWTDLGGGTTGISGQPLLTMSGSLLPASFVSLDLVNAAPLELALVFVSFSSAPTSFLGGTLHTFPFDELVIIGTDALGELHGSAPFPGAASCQGLWFQMGIQDLSVPIFGASLSNGVKGTVP